MVSVSLMLCLFRHTLATTTNTQQFNKVRTHLTTETSAKDLTSVLGETWNMTVSKWNGIDVIYIAEGTYVGNDIEIIHRSLELSGQRSSGRNASRTRILPSNESKRKMIDNIQAMERSVFSLTNSTLSLKSLHLSLVDSSEEEKKLQLNEKRAPRLVVVSSSILTISESRIETSRWTSTILISPSTSKELAVESSVVVSQCRISNDIGELRGLVETEAFPAIGESISVSIVGCSFDSQAVLGKDGIGLSLTQNVQKSAEEVVMISSSLIGCSFVNMSSIGSSNQPHLSHLSQKMLGCVVSLTSEHLSGSTLRDVNSGGSVLCSNSSFSTLLSSPNTDPDSSQGTVTRPGQDPETFEDGTTYSFLYESPDFDLMATSALFLNCRFTGADYASARPLTFQFYSGTISVLVCSFTGVSTTVSGGSLSVFATDNYDRICFTATSSNFTSCSSTKSGGVMAITVTDHVLIESCRFENCSTTAGTGSDGGAIELWKVAGGSFVAKRLELVDCVFTGCKAGSRGAGVFVGGAFDLSVVDTTFEQCEIVTGSSKAFGGGICVNGGTVLTVERGHFIGCSSRQEGGAISSINQIGLTVSDTLVKECFSGTTGAIYHSSSDEKDHLSFSCVYFDGNAIGEDTFLFPSSLDLEENTTNFPDMAIMFTGTNPLPTLEFENCFTTISPDSTGMIIGRTDAESGLYKEVRHWDEEFNNIGPLLTAAPTARLNEETGKIELEMKGKTPLTSQEYEVTMKDERGTEQQFRMMFSDGTGTLLSDSESPNLQCNTSYTITKIVGVVPEYCSSTLSNAITVHVAQWTFNLAATPDFLTFTTPSESSITTPEIPSFSTLQDATARIIESDPQLAYVILHFDKEVSGSYDFVVLEEGKPVTLTINNEVSSKFGGTKEFKVIGDGKLLTHDMTYTIESILPTPGTESMTTNVHMNETITFHIPKSSFDPKKALSAETKRLLSWLIPLIACLLVALVLAVIIIVLLRRRQQKNTQPAQKEMEEQDQLQIEDKMEVVEVEYTNRVIKTDGLGHPSPAPSDAQSTRENPSQGELKDQTQAEWVEVMGCSGAFEISAAPMSNTLYSVLHKEHREIGKRGIGIQIVNGLKQVVDHRGWSDVLTRLSSHWILIDTAGNVQLKLQMNASEAEQEAAQAQMQNPNIAGNENEQHGHETRGPVGNEEKEKSGMDGLRWRAPEVVASGVGGQVDGHKASVFSLGLVLWEIETGQVPFGEVDAVNAQRQSGTGIGPKMESLQNTEFVSLIHRCVSVNPKDRPTLSEIGEFLSSHQDDTNGESRNEMKD
ncbi:hypothetical protein BLNAU_22016 [Blattamonas nauphoetae]|uniref:Protein kinase domain-containing protein n=1 Tax=Blattamonas nauphoetae TaxID=2049346 RepID=A0ABQ9WU80_9EUKA|nr:hypothetical protein BLNAU_22016 [Blattamonas nauphoetae]